MEESKEKEGLDPHQKKVKHFYDKNEPAYGPFRSLLLAFSKLEQTASSSEPVSSASECANPLCKQPFTQSSDNSARQNYCPTCQSAYDNKQYCEYCEAIYIQTKEEGAIVDGQRWAQCDMCERWNHVGCATKNGVPKEIFDSEISKYYCRDCKNKTRYNT